MEQVNKLSHADQERIKADAKHYADVEWGDPSKFTTLNQSIQHGNCEEDYLAGATAENSRAQPLADLLEMIKTLGPVDGLTIKLIDKKLQQWNEGKEVGNGK